jgi:hypothetical protein
MRFSTLGDRPLIDNAMGILARNFRSATPASAFPTTIRSYHHHTMPKAKRRNNAGGSGGGADSSPYAKPAAKSATANSIFKMNTDLGQHILKNPGVANAIVQKANLKQSGMLQLRPSHTPLRRA